MEPIRQRNTLIHISVPSRDGQTRFLIVAGIGLALVGILIGWYLIWGPLSVVPKKIQKSVDFTIYYPAARLPGYALDTQSFRLAEPGVVIFAVAQSNGKNIIFSEQDQPSSGDIDKFISTYLPLNTVVKLPRGQAKVGAFGSAPNIQTVVSFPIRNGPWLMVTAPSNVSHDDLVKLLASLTD